MAIAYCIHYNKEKKRTEFLLKNYDYFDGNEYLAGIFQKEYRLRILEKQDGIWFMILRLGKKRNEYEMVWHEDVGNFIYCVEQSCEANDQLEKRLKHVIDIANKQLI